MEKLKLWMFPYRAGRGLPIVLLLALAVLLACQSPLPVVTTPAPTLVGDNLAFETIEQDDWPRTGNGYIEVGPELTVITTLDDLDRLSLHVSLEALDALASLDYDTQLGLIVYQGSKPSTGFGVTIHEIVERDAQVMVLAEFKTPAPNQEAGAEQTSPYQIVSVERANLKGVMTFVLMDAQTLEILLERDVTFDE